MSHALAALWKPVFVTVAALLPIVNPLGTAPIFLSVSADLPAAAQRRLAWQVARNATLLLAGAMLVGSHVLDFFGISLPIVRVGGGLLVTANGWRLVNADDTARPKSEMPVREAWDREIASRAFYPLTFPLTVGPGSISIAITLGARVAGRGTSKLIDLLVDLVGVAIIGFIVHMCYRFASRLIAALGETGTTVFLRLSAFILLCVGVAIVWSGVEELITPLLSHR